MDAKDRLSGLRKLPQTPVGEILARHRVKLDLPPEADPALPPAEMLARLEAAGRPFEMIRLLAHALPKREATWWACLAARDILPEGARWPSLDAAEAWVFRPGGQTREAVMKAAQGAAPDEESTYAANAALHAMPGPDGRELAAPGTTALMVEAQLLKSLFAVEGPEAIEARQRLLLARGLDIARGGNGRVDAEGRPAPRA